jgi:hypothetical protein
MNSFRELNPCSCLSNKYVSLPDLALSPQVSQESFKEILWEQKGFVNSRIAFPACRESLGRERGRLCEDERSSPFSLAWETRRLGRVKTLSVIDGSGMTSGAKEEWEDNWSQVLVVECEEGHHRLQRFKNKTTLEIKVSEHLPLIRRRSFPYKNSDGV